MMASTAGNGKEVTGRNQEASPPANEPAETQSGTTRTRKRTKTGCLTCRKRRIKCGEERPVCANCIKSKRSCEGYAPRLIFKDHLGPFGPLSSQNAYRRPQPGPYTEAAPGNSRYTPIMPREPPIYPQPQQPQQMEQNWAHNLPTNPMYPANDPRTSYPPSTVPQAGSALYSGPGSMESNPYGLMTPPTISPTTFRERPLPNDINFGPPLYDIQQSQATQRVHDSYTSESPGYGTTATPVSLAGSYPVSLDPLVARNQGMWPTASQTYDDIITNVPTSQNWEAEVGPPLPTVQETVAGPSAALYIEDGLAEEPDDDYYDVETDEEELITHNQGPVSTHRDVSLMQALQAMQGDNAPRSYSTFLDVPNMLANYIPKFTSSPLMDSTTARIFAHYIVATAPSLSVFERHPINPSIIFSGKPVPKSHQSLWTYTLPMMALSNQGLLQSILALASLQICRLQQVPITASMKHYHYGLRKVAKAVATPSKRSTIATLAATLLLGHYEATTAEHSKWSSHLAGARQLLLEVDFKGISRRIKEMKAQYGDPSLANWYNPYVNSQYHPFPADLPWFPEPNGVDEKIVSQLIGWKVQYDRFGAVIDEQDSHKLPLTVKEIDDFQTFRDLFWWFCKHDIIQSVISGNRLLLPYDRWVHCSPRAPIGKLDAIYGTMDHVLLLAGRVADFAYRDRIRKVKVMKRNGGQWIPPPDLFTQPPFGPPPGAAGPPGAPPGAPPAGGPPQGAPPGGAPPGGAPPGRASQPPQFYGMMPTSGAPPKPPPSFKSAPREQIYNDPPVNEEFTGEDLDAATADALAEWSEIQKAFEMFESSLGPAFAPLPPEVSPPIPSPFGTALQYRTYHIATIWAYFWTSRIISMRTHPSMPPATLMATGVAAMVTKPWTQIIGRITMGLQAPPPGEDLSPTLGSAMTESMLSMFFSGVQFMEAEQRAAVIARLRLISDRVGVESAALIAVGLERYWVRLHEMGRGPKYKLTMTPTDDEVMLGRKMMTGAGLQVEKKREDGDGAIERSFVYISKDTQRNWGHGVMGLNQDLEKLDLNG